MSDMDRLNIKVERRLKERFRAVVLAKKGEKGTISDAIRAFMIRECDKFEISEREERRKEEEHQAKMTMFCKKSNRQAS